MKACPSCKTQYPGGEAFCPLDGARLVSASAIALGASASDPLIGSVLGDRYKILRRVGEGGMGIVYEAEHIVIEKHVALKVLREDFGSRPDVVERFRQEAKSASRIGHENIVDISDFGETPSGASYFVMEMLDGEDLADRLAREGTIDPARAVSILIQCCRALGAAHQKGIVHRDMKPENIFLIERAGTRDFVKIVDFGIAKMSDIETAGAPGRKLTKTGMIFGTPEYMSPEQAAGKPLDHRVDVYALGVILFEVLTGRVPFLGDTFMGVLTQHMFDPVPPLREINARVQISPALEAVLFRALAKDPDQRFQSMDELARALTAVGDPAHAGFAPTLVPEEPLPLQRKVVRSAPEPEPTIDDIPRLPHRGRGALVAGLLVGVLAVGGAAAWFVTSRRDDATPLAGGTAAIGALLRDGVDAAVAPVRDVALAVGTPDLGPPTLPFVDASAAAVEADAGAAPSGDVVVRVVTHPEGALVTIDDRGTVCEETPCEVRTPVGEAVTLRARRARASASRTFRPLADMDLELTLTGGRSGPRVGGSGGASDDGPGLGELKTPDWATSH
jgi:tRNA A-37 threonylcarbamoyl transferase component Bud32